MWHALPDGSKISAEAAILLDAASGRVLWEYEPHRRMYPASLTKMMSGLLAAESGSLDRRCVASAAAAATGESSIALQPGEALTLRQVLQGSLIKSANDATVMLAESVGGSVPGFVTMMNDRAAVMGLRDTHFANPHGLHDPAHYSSAADLGEIARAVLATPDLARIVGTREAVIPWQGKPWMRKLLNRNRLLLHWSECDGVKTGYTRQAGRCLAASAGVSGWQLVCVVLKCHNSWDDARTLLQYGFHNYTRTPVVRTQDVYRVAVQRGRERYVRAHPQRNVYAVLGRGEEPPQATLDARAAVAPITPGQAVGVLTVGAAAAESTQLVADAAVPLSVWARICDIKLPQAASICLVALAAGVLTHGASAKTARARRRRLQARKRDAGRPGEGDDQRAVG